MCGIYNNIITQHHGHSLWRSWGTWDRLGRHRVDCNYGPWGSREETPYTAVCRRIGWAWRNQSVSLNGHFLAPRMQQPKCRISVSWTIEFGFQFQNWASLYIVEGELQTFIRHHLLSDSSITSVHNSTYNALQACTCTLAKEWFCWSICIRVSAPREWLKRPKSAQEVVTLPPPSELGKTFWTRLASN